MKNCLVCGVDISHSHGCRKFCISCSDKRKVERNRISRIVGYSVVGNESIREPNREVPFRVPRVCTLRNPNPNGLSTAAVGKVSELTTAIDLIERGYHVYQAILPSSPCDFVAVRFDGPSPIEMKLVEATTGWKTLSGELRCPDHNSKLEKCHELAIVFDKQVNYISGGTAGKDIIP